MSVPVDEASEHSVEKLCGASEPSEWCEQKNERANKWPFDKAVYTSPSRGLVNRSGIAKERSHFVLVTNDWPTNRPTDQNSKF